MVIAKKTAAKAAAEAVVTGAKAVTDAGENLKTVEKATAATKESSKTLIEDSRKAQLNCKAKKYGEHLKIISGHAADKQAWEAAESDRAVAAKKLADE